jgi:hypothetical protein
MFTLPAVYALAEPLRRTFPDNQSVEANIRQGLSSLPSSSTAIRPDASRVHAGTALRSTARRAGWDGALIDLAGLERESWLSRNSRLGRPL